MPDINSKDKCRILIVDDSVVIRGFLDKAVSGESSMVVAGHAGNGKLAVEKVKELRPDVVLMDIEMPEMDGLTALQEVLKIQPDLRVIMVSTLTAANAQVSIKALSLGAADYLEKPSAMTNKEEFKKILIEKIKGIFFAKNSWQSTADAVEDKNLVVKGGKAKPMALAIGCSTGGPQALLSLFSYLRKDIDNMPIFITQHMPPKFTTFLADNISKECGVPCVEGSDGLEVTDGMVYMAPGDYHMLTARKGENVYIKLSKSAPENFCRPAVDPMLRSMVQVYGGNILVMMLTGMGQDGLDGAKAVVNAGGEVIAQDQMSSVVWGMPGAVAKAGICSKVAPINELAEFAVKLCKGRR